MGWDILRDNLYTALFSSTIHLVAFSHATGCHYVAVNSNKLFSDYIRNYIGNDRFFTLHIYVMRFIVMNQYNRDQAIGRLIWVGSDHPPYILLNLPRFN